MTIRAGSGSPPAATRKGSGVSASPDTDAGAAAPGPASAAYVLSRVPSQKTHRSCSASYSHTDSPSTTIPTRSPRVRCRKPSPSLRPSARSWAARRYRLSDSSALASSGRGSAVRASGAPGAGGVRGTETRRRPSTQADQPLEHATYAQSPRRSRTCTGSSASSGSVGRAT
ncbi:hypothetical protein SBADM41S_01591 [Streptomyces badius]